MPNIKIRIEKGVQTAGDGKENQEAKQTDREQPIAEATKMVFYHQAIATGKQILSYATSNVANFTGNNLLQDQVNQTMEIIGDLTTLAMGATRGWTGLAVAGIGLATKKVFEAMSIVQENRHLENEQNYLLKRSGNSTTNGSRGTEN